MHQMSCFYDLKLNIVRVYQFQVYRELNAAQRHAFDLIGRRLVSRIKPLTKPQSFHLTFKLVELYEKTNPPLP